MKATKSIRIGMSPTLGRGACNLPKYYNTSVTFVLAPAYRPFNYIVSIVKKGAAARDLCHITPVGMASHVPP